MFLRKPNNLAGVAGVLTAAWAALMGWQVSQYPFPHIFPQDLNSPVLALELACDKAGIDAVLHPSDPKAPKAVGVISLNTKLDLVFIPLYSLFLWSVARVFRARNRRLTLLIFGTALFDYIENWQIFRALKGGDPAICLPSFVKWGLLAVVLLFTAFILLRSANAVYSVATKRLLAIGYVASGGLIIIAIAVHRYSWIDLAMRVFGVLVIVNIIGMLGHYFSVPGIAQQYVENFCEERKKAGAESLAAVKPKSLK